VLVLERNENIMSVQAQIGLMVSRKKCLVV